MRAGRFTRIPERPEDMAVPLERSGATHGRDVSALGS
jgi:hypothetical protein